jgi:hypothetical protein
MNIHLTIHAVSETSLSVCNHQIMTWIVKTLLQMYKILYSAYDGTEHHHAEDLVEHTGLFFHTVA